ncbi:MAG: hypothetical protein ACLPXB_15955 [Thiobacillaceae bacterium]
MPLKSVVQRASSQQAIAIFAIAALLWIKYFGTHGLRDIADCLIILISVSVGSYYTLRAIVARRKHRAVLSDCVVLARARLPVSFYAGVAGVGIGFTLNVIVFSMLFFDLTNLEHRLNSAERGASGLHLWLGGALCFFALGFLYAWLGAYQLRLTASSIEYWSMFGGYQAMERSDIKAVRTITLGSRRPYRLEILPVESSSIKNSIVVNLKVLHQVDVEGLFKWLEPKLDGRR